MTNIDKKLAEIKAYKEQCYVEMNEKYPEPCLEWEKEEEELLEEISKRTLAVYAEWEESPEYASFKKKQQQNLRNRYYA